MKKILAMLVVLSMVFCFVACGPEADPTPDEAPKCTDHVDNNNDGICDNEGCGATVKADGGDDTYVPTPVSPDVAAAYVNAIWGAVENAKTVTATLDLTSYQAQSDIVDANGKVMYEAQENAMSVHFDLTLAMSENGLNLKITGNATMDNEEQKMEAYIVDGIGYARTMEDGEWTDWVVSPIELPEEATGMITEFTAIVEQLLPEDFAVTPEMITEIKAAFASAVTALMTVNADGSFGMKADSKPVIDEVVEFITSIKAEDTIGATINKVLALVDPEMTIEAILDGVGAYGAVTVGELYEALNATIEETYSMDINAIKNAILSEEAIVSLLIENGADAEMISNILATNVEVMLADYMEATIDDLVYMIVMSQSAPDAEVQPVIDEDTPAGDEPVDTAGTLAAMMAEVKAMLSMTVGDMAGEQYATVMEVLGSIDLRANYAYINFKLGADLSIEKIEIGQKLDVTITTPTVEYEKVEVGEDDYEAVPVECTVTATMKMETVFTITSVSNATTTITAPEGAPEYDAPAVAA